MSSSSNNRVLPIVLGAAALILGLLAALWLNKPASIVLQSGTLLPQSRALPALALTDQDGQPFGAEQLRGHWTVIFPGFTSCPDICPTTLAMLRETERQLGEQAQDLRIVMLTIDPERDTPEKLKLYLRSFSPRFIGLTTPEPQLGELARTLGVAYIKVPGSTPDTYTMDHTAALVLLNPRGELAGYLTPPFDPAKLKTDFSQLLAQN